MVAEIFTSLNIPPFVYVVVVLALTLIIKSWLQTPSNLPPCPVRPYPIVGHLPYMKDRPRETLKEFRKKAGDIYTLYTGSQLTVVFNGYDVIRDTLVKQADIFSDRPISSINSLFKDGTKGIIGSSGHSWKEQRSVSLAILRSFGMGKNVLAEKIQDEVSAYMDELAKFKGQPQEVRTLTNVAVSNVICAIIVGKRFEYSDPYLIRLLLILNEQGLLIRSVTLRNSSPWLRYLPGDLFNIKKLIKNNDDLLEHFCYPFIEKFSKKLDEGEEDDDSAVSFITSYLKELKHKQATGESTTMEDHSHLVHFVPCGVETKHKQQESVRLWASHVEIPMGSVIPSVHRLRGRPLLLVPFVEQLARVIQNLFVAGSETTSTTMLWFVLYMLHNPEVQKKIFKEINDVVGTERVVALQDKPQLTYLNAAIRETQRLANIVPFNLPHANTVEVKVRGYTIPAGTSILTNLDSVLHDEKIWGDPMNFRPERFLDKTGKLINREEFIPFSLGRRVCLGESLAKMELFLFLSALVQKFEFLPAKPNNLPPLKYQFGITCPPEAYEVRFVERRN